MNRRKLARRTVLGRKIASRWIFKRVAFAAARGLGVRLGFDLGSQDIGAVVLLRNGIYYSGGSAIREVFTFDATGAAGGRAACTAIS